MLTQERIKEIFAKANAIITGDHFVYAKKADGWYHGPDYVNKDAIYPFVGLVDELCREIANHFSKFGIEAVVGPAIGAVSLSQWTAHRLTYMTRQEVLAIFADEEDVLQRRHFPIAARMLNFEAFGTVSLNNSFDSSGKIDLAEVNYFAKIGTGRVIKRGYDKLIKGKRCLIVEDIINSGITVAKTRDAVIAVGGEVIGVGCLCNRSGGRVTAQTLCVPELFSLLDLDMKMFPEADCPICREKGQQSVRTDLGKGREFLRQVGLS
jgi:orotate phosphoribosyltransferase